MEPELSVTQPPLQCHYILKVFNEEVNDDNYTDYASTMKEITLRVQTPAKVDFDTTNVDKEVTLEFSDSSLTDADTVNITTTKASDKESIRTLKIADTINFWYLGLCSSS